MNSKKMGKSLQGPEGQLKKANMIEIVEDWRFLKELALAIGVVPPKYPFLKSRYDIAKEA